MRRMLLALMFGASLFLGSAATGDGLGYNCGFPPFPPFGCKMVCVCDARGQNCHWESVCSH